jgi:putative membrane protein
VELYIRWQTDPVLIGGILTLALCYTLAVGPLRHLIAPGKAFPRNQAIIFYAGIILMYLTEGSPLHDLAERYSFFAHMLQHTLLSYVVAPLLLLGAPAWLLRWMLSGRAIQPVAKVVLSPLPAFLLFSVGFSIWHIPVIYDMALRDPFIHHMQHLIFLALSVIMWWPLISPLDDLGKPSKLGKLVYIFLLPIAQLPVFGAVTFAVEPLYPSYQMAPVWIFETHLQDQAAGGAMMNLAGLFAFGIPFIIIFINWYREDYGRTIGGRRIKAVQEDIG